LHALLIALLLFLPPAQGAAPGLQAGNPQNGKTLWDGKDTSCKNCHGVNAEGAFAPDLAGRKLTYEQFRHAVRHPWGIMPHFVEAQVSDQDIADIYAYFQSLPRVDKPGEWHFTAPPNAPPGQKAAIVTIGCGQCHGVTLNTPREGMGAVAADVNFEWFKRTVYDHATTMPLKWKLLEDTAPGRVRMGTYSPSRLPEPLLKQIFDFASSLGFIPALIGRVGPGRPDESGGVTYPVTVRNNGLIGSGLTAEDVTVTLVLPKDSTVVSGGGEGYVGVGRDPESGRDAAIWRLAHLAPKERQILTITMAKPLTAGFRGSVTWTKPTPQPTDTIRFGGPQIAGQTADGT
jgi:mono/diheme cytochrome c family protein